MAPNNESSRDSDVAVIGTGIAPLIAASHLISQGKSVLVLNPDFDFFLEDSELPLDPMFPLLADSLKPEKLVQQDAEHVLAELRPLFPGAVETWVTGSQLVPAPRGFHDPDAPHVRQRNRLWIQSELGTSKSASSWSALEDAYVGASDMGLNPRILEGIHAGKKFPGFASSTESYRGLLIPKFCDVDVTRYRNGILEFVRERLGLGRFIVAATQIEPMPGGLRFYSGGKPCTARIEDRVLVFWTPRMTSWVMGQARRAEVEPKLPRGIRLWEQWSLVSRDELDPEVIGTFEDMVVWAELEGNPASEKTGQKPDRLSVLRSGPLLKLGEISDSSWASGESLNALSSLCYDFLKWGQFSIRSMKPRAIFEWPETNQWDFKSSSPRLSIIPGCDGPLVQVVRTAREAAS
jgi:hypothetical protein